MSRSYISSSGVEHLRVVVDARPTGRRASATRSGTVAIVHASGSIVVELVPRRTASTPARPARARTDHAPNTVLCGAFWLKSTKIRSPRSSFHHASVITSGRRRASSRATATAARRTSIGVHRGSSRMYTWMPRLPVVLGQPADAELVEQTPSARAPRRGPRRTRRRVAGRGRCAARRRGRRRTRGWATRGSRGTRGSPPRRCARGRPRPARATSCRSVC